MAAAPDQAGWRVALGAKQQTPPREHGELGLLLQLRTLVRDGSQWTAPKAESATSVRSDRPQRLGVRPVYRNARGTWVTGEVGWSSIAFKTERLSLAPAQVAWFSQFMALHRASGETFRATEPDWLFLDEFASPLLWPLLEEAAEVGIALVTGKHTDRVHLLPGADAAVRIDQDTHTRGLRVTAEIAVEGQPILPTGTIGNHGIYACRFDAGLHLQLAPASAAAVELAQWRGRAQRVPARDVAEFWRDHYPALTRRIDVRSDGLTLPVVEQETILVVTFEPRDTLTTRWERRYGAVREPLPEPPAVVPDQLSGADAAEFVAHELPRLEAAGVRVITVGERPDYREAEEPPRLRFTAVPSGSNDWLDLGFVITVGEYTVSFADVFSALSKGRSKILLVDKSYLSLDHPLFDALRDLIEEGARLGEWETGAIVSRYHAPRFEPFRDDADEAPEAVLWRTAAAGMITPPSPIPPPEQLNATLRPYQLDGFRWLAHLWQHNLGGILADDMGLGKTVQTIALFLHAAATDPDQRFLVVAPTSVVGNWMDELARFAPSLTAAAVASVRDPIPAAATVVVTSYALFRLEQERFREQVWSVLVLDEAQMVKNPASQAHDCALALPARVKLAVTGTPMENSLMDLWSILQITAPGLFASRIRFSDRYVKAHSATRIAELRRRIRPLMLRRTKQLVAAELPPKQEQTVLVDLFPAHRARYDRQLQRERQKILGLVEDLDRNRFIIFRSITLLRLLALDPRLVPTEDDDEDAEPPVTSAKLDALLSRIDDLTAEGHRALVFSQFTGYLALVRERLDARGIAYEYLDGATTRRPAVIDRFRTGSAPLFLISLRAGGVGLTLTEADTVFLLDPWWNPATEAQAIDRTHRIGQDDPVMVYRLIARDTVEEKVLALGDSKRTLFEEVIDGGSAFSTALTAADVRALLGED